MSKSKLEIREEARLNLKAAHDEVLKVGKEHYLFADERECFRQCRRHSPHLGDQYQAAHSAYMKA